MCSYYVRVFFFLPPPLSFSRPDRLFIRPMSLRARITTETNNNNNNNNIILSPLLLLLWKWVRKSYSNIIHRTRDLLLETTASANAHKYSEFKFFYNFSHARNVKREELSFSAISDHGYFDKVF